MLKKLVATAIVVLVGLGAPAVLYANGQQPKYRPKPVVHKPDPGHKPGRH